MAERRMFAKTIIDSDAFLDMPLSTQALYFHLSMRADDEGFINNPKKIKRMIGASDDDLKLLIAKNFVIPFESGVVVIKHWRIHNYIRSDRLVKTVYKDEREALDVKENGAYTMADRQQAATCQSLDGHMSVNCPSSDGQMAAQVRLGEVRLGKDSIGEDSIEDVCTEPLQSSAPETAMNAPGIPLTGGVEWRPTVDELNEWIKFYSAVDVIRELGRMRIWCQNNPDRKKTARGVRRFVTTWLDKEQNRAGQYTRGQQRQATGADAYFEMAQEAMGNGTGGN